MPRYGTSASRSAKSGSRPQFNCLEITRITAWTRTGNAAARVDVRISGVSVLAAPLAPAIGVGAAPAVLAIVQAATRFGGAGSTIDVYLTTDAGAVMDDCLVVIEWRPRVYRHSP
jgi:hypothetical protein